jgi:hypothetical protein
LQVKNLLSLQGLEAIVCDENDVIAPVLDADFEMTEVVKHSPAFLHACSEPSEQSLKLFSLPGVQLLDRISSFALPEFKCTDSSSDDLQYSQ